MKKEITARKGLNQSEFQTLNLTRNLNRKLHSRYPSDRKTISATKIHKNITKIIFKILYYYTSLFTEKDRTPKRKSILQRTRRMQIKGQNKANCNKNGIVQLYRLKIKR